MYKSYVFPTQCVYVFCKDLRANSDCIPVPLELIGFVTETQRVYCAVRTESLNTI